MTTTLLRGGRVFTPTDHHATAMLVTDGTVTWIGPDAGTQQADITVELAGALVAPAFVDAHVHATQTGLALDGLDLYGAPSLAAALDQVAAHARSTRGQVILGTGWDQTDWPERRPPTAAELDRASAGSAVYLSRVDGHSAAVSNALLAACPAARTMVGYDPGGHVHLDAHHAVRATAYSSITPTQRAAAQRATRGHAASLGIGCLHEMAGPLLSSTEDVEALVALAAAEPGPDVLAYWGELGGAYTARDLGLAGAGGDLFCDGSLGSHTAALRAPYHDRPATSGTLRYTPDQIAEHVVECTKVGVQAGFHAIGDRALGAILEGMRRAAHEVGHGELWSARHRIEHVEMPPDVAAFAELGLACSMQPAFDATWGGTHGMYAERLGALRAAGLNPFAALAAAGVGLAFGSDSPVTPVNPWGGVRAAIHHRTEGAGVNLVTAFTAATYGGWWAARQEAGGAGTLAAGAPATYAVWDVPVPDPDGSGLPDLTPGTPPPTCLRTVVRGTTVFTAEQQ